MLRRTLQTLLLSVLIIELSNPLKAHAQSLKSNGYRLDIDWEESSLPSKTDAPSPKTTSLMPTKGYMLEQRTHKDDTRIVGINLSSEATDDSAHLTLTAKDLGVSLTISSLAQSRGKYGILPATHCDNKDCTYQQAGRWTQDTTSGFGYTLNGPFIPSDFRSSTSFRPLSNPHNSEKPAVILNRFLSKNTELTIGFKSTTNETTRQAVELTVLPWY